MQFKQPKRVFALSSNKQWAFVEGSKVGIPVNQLEVVDQPEPIDAGSFFELMKKTSSVQEIEKKPENDIRVLLEGDRLQIQANIDLDGIKRLRKILDAHEQLLCDGDMDE